METIQHLLHFILHIDTYLVAFVSAYGIWTYVILFLIIFCETGLVITPFLPGDSLLFAAGSIAANSNEMLSIQLLFGVLTLASIVGNKVNYLIGKGIGPRIFSAEDSWFLNKKHLTRAHLFYEKHGGKTIILARFIPIIRTFAPFIAGVAYMSVKEFTVYNIVSAVCWVGAMLCLGYYFGSIPIIKENFTVAIYVIVLLSVFPPTCAFLYRKFLRIS